MRLFIALPVTRRCREQIWGLSQRLQKRDPLARWERPEKFHLTLAFLGEQPDEKADCQALSRVEGREFALTFSHLGRFPGEKGDVIFLRPQPSHPLMEIQKRLVQQLEQEGIFLEKRPFSPHITLLRRGKKETAWERLPLSPLVLPVRTISLMESIPSPGGTSYRILHQIHLEEMHTNRKERSI